MIQNTFALFHAMHEKVSQQGLHSYSESVQQGDDGHRSQCELTQNLKDRRRKDFCPLSVCQNSIKTNKQANKNQTTGKGRHKKKNSKKESTQILARAKDVKHKSAIQQCCRSPYIMVLSGKLDSQGFYVLADGREEKQLVPKMSSFGKNYIWQFDFSLSPIFYLFVKHSYCRLPANSQQEKVFVEMNPCVCKIV